MDKNYKLYIKGCELNRYHAMIIEKSYPDEMRNKNEVDKSIDYLLLTDFIKDGMHSLNKKGYAGNFLCYTYVIGFERKKDIIDFLVL